MAMAVPSQKVCDLLKARQRPVVTIGPDDTVEAAIRKLVQHNIGALPVCDSKGGVLGIVSERDLLKECAERPRNIGATKVKDVMTKEVVIGIPDDDLDYVMDVMTQQCIRHLPIIEGRNLQAMLSMRDVVDVLLEQSKAQVRFLSDYISGGYQ